MELCLLLCVRMRAINYSADNHESPKGIVHIMNTLIAVTRACMNADLSL